MWQGAAYTFLAWGVGHGLVLALERAGWLDTARWKLGSLPVFLCATLLWIPFRADSMAQAGRFLRAMSGFEPGTPLWADPDRVLANPKVMFLLLVPGVICLAADRPFLRLRNMAWRRPLLAGAGSIALYLLACLSVVEAGFNAFIYFQF